MIQGTDLSHWNDKVDYVAMKAAGIRFACIKLGQGLLPIDNMFAVHTARCDALGIPWDLYWYCDYRYTGAQNVLRLLTLANGNFGRKHVVCDLEFNDSFGARPNGAHMLAFVLQFFDALETATGIIAMLYSNLDVIKQMWAAADPSQKARLLRHPLWFASDSATPVQTPWPAWQLNQWQLDVIMPWAHGTVDLDEYNGDEEEFQAWIGGPAPAHPVYPSPEWAAWMEKRTSELERRLNLLEPIGG
jgi:GH25 family lysozyme M1 (1,4-beta-N-acetylmuramidase)